jgi:hypothetical protein
MDRVPVLQIWTAPPISELVSVISRRSLLGQLDRKVHLPVVRHDPSCFILDHDKIPIPIDDGFSIGIP